MEAERETRAGRLRTLLRSETRVHLVFEYVMRPDGTWVAMCGMPEAQAEGASYTEARERLRLAMAALIGTAVLRQATLIEDVPYGALDDGMAY